MRAKEFIIESAEVELAKKLPTLKKHDYDTIDRLMQSIAAKHRITGKILHDKFVSKYDDTPDNWIKDRVAAAKELEEVDSDGLHNDNFEDNELMQEFIDWSCAKLGVKHAPKFEWSSDTQEAQDGHHTGRHTNGSNVCWVYVKNRNLVDIMRTVFHELVHVRQGELGMIKPGDSYPGSPIEVMADALAGKYIKIFGEKHHEIFE